VTTERTDRHPRPAGRKPARKSREELLVEHRAARALREAAPLGSDAYRAAVEEIARIEVAINELQEPDRTPPPA
jgi:hypothetical protein